MLNYNDPFSADIMYKPVAARESFSAFLFLKERNFFGWEGGGEAELFSIKVSIAFDNR